MVMMVMLVGQAGRDGSGVMAVSASRREKSE